MARQRASGKRANEMVASTSGFRGTVRRRVALFAGGALLVTSAVWSGPGTARADAGNPILGTIHGSLQPNPDGTVTVFVRGQWNWLSHNSDCNFDRAATGVGMIWNDPTEPGFTVTKAPISAGVGIAAIRSGTAPVGENPNAYPDTYNTVDEMVHPVDRGNQAEGYTSGTFKSTTQGYSTSAAGDFPSGHPFGEAMSLTCANGTTTCSGHPWGSWGYEKVTGMARGYSHTYAQRRDISQVCVNFYDVHGGGKASSSSFQAPNGTKEIDVNGNGDNSIQTNAFNTNQGANCVNFPFIDHTTAVTDVLVGGNIHDQAFIGGAAAAQVTYLQFHLFAPSDPTCAGTDLYSGGRIAVTGSGTATSDDVVATPAGDFHWTADLFDAAAGGDLLDSTKCGDLGETSHVDKKKPTIGTTASGAVTIGQAIHDVAQLGNLVSGVAPTGTITFKAYAPNANGSADPSCGTAVFTDVEPVDSSGKATSGSFTPSGTAPQIAGTYEWTASYSGDDNYKAVTSKCNDTGEQSLDNKQSTTTPTGQKVLISDFAKPTGFGTPTGTVTFSLFDNAGCTGTPIFTQTTSLVNGLAHADDPTPLNADGTYKWVVTYNGDANNSPSTSPCGTEFTTLGGNTPGVDP